jgi:guanylate kinase
MIGGEDMAGERDSFIVIISAPSGSGKTTIVDRVIEDVPGMARSISYTTRSPREGEKDGEDYRFVSKDEFRAMIEKGELLEWEQNFDHFYGTSKEQVRNALGGGKDIVLSIDVKGARKVKEEFPESISVFIMPPSRKELEARLKGRNTDMADQVALRLGEADKEIEASDEYDYLVINEDLDDAVMEVMGIVAGERKKRASIAEKDGK